MKHIEIEKDNCGGRGNRLRNSCRKQFLVALELVQSLVLALKTRKVAIQNKRAFSKLKGYFAEDWTKERQLILGLCGNIWFHIVLPILPMFLAIIGFVTFAPYGWLGLVCLVLYILGIDFGFHMVIRLLAKLSF